jgi:hypothetical protein
MVTISCLKAGLANTRLLMVRESKDLKQRNTHRQQRQRRQPGGIQQTHGAKGRVPFRDLERQTKHQSLDYLRRVMTGTHDLTAPPNLAQ